MSGIEIAAAIGLAGSALAGASQVAQGIQANRIAKDEADRRRQFGRIEADRVRQEGTRLRAAQRVAFAKAGVLPTGTPLDVLAQTAEAVELDALGREYERNRESDLLRFKGKQQKAVGLISGATTLLSGGSRAAELL